MAPTLALCLTRSPSRRRWSRLLGKPPRPTSRGGTITRPFLEDVAEALRVSSTGLDKVQLTRRLVEAVGEPWDERCASAHTASGGGGNITLTALQRLLEGVRGHASLASAVSGGARLRYAMASGVRVGRSDSNQGHLDVNSLEDARWRLRLSGAAPRTEPISRASPSPLRGRCAISGCDAEAALEAAPTSPRTWVPERTWRRMASSCAPMCTPCSISDLSVSTASREPSSSPMPSINTVYSGFAGSPLTEPWTERCRPTEAVLLWRAEHIGPLSALG